MTRLGGGSAGSATELVRRTPGALRPRLAAGLPFSPRPWLCLRHLSAAPSRGLNRPFVRPEMREAGPGPPSRDACSVGEGLPGAAGRAAALAGGGAGAAGGAAVHLVDDERGARLRDRRDLVVVRLGRIDRDRGLRQIETGVLALDVVVGVRAGAVRAVVGVARLDLRRRVTRGRLGVGVLALRLLAEEGRKRDGGKDADNENHNEELDEREALLLAAQTLGKPLKHVGNASLNRGSCASRLDDPL